MLIVTFGATGVAYGQDDETQDEEGVPAPLPWDGQTAVRVYAQGSLGLFGDVRARSETMRTGAAVSPSAGVAAGVEIPLAHAFSLGVEANAWNWSASSPGTMSVSNSWLLEASFVPRFRNPWALPTGEHFAIGLAIPIGPSLSLLHNGSQTDATAVLGARDGTGEGMHVGALVELQAFVLPHFGFTFDAGYIHHFLWHGSAIAGQRDVQIDFGQAVARLGVIVAI
jgi:hypothetical protein